MGGVQNGKDANGILCKGLGERWPFMVVVCVVSTFVGKIATMHTTSKIKPPNVWGISLSFSPENLIAMPKWLVIPDVNFYHQEGN